MTDFPPNHHADYPQFSGIFGYVGALKMILGRREDAEFINDTAHVRPGDQVLDLGCGPGAAARLAARRGATVIGLDPSRPMLRVAKLLSATSRPQGRVRWIEAGAEDTRLDDDSIDICWTLKALHHWPDLEGGLAETARVVKPGGTFLALEKRCEPGATGNASHGWTPQQAHTLGEMLPDYGFSKVSTSEHVVAKKPIMLVVASR